MESEISSRPFAIAAFDLEVALDNPRIYRDIYYTPTIVHNGEVSATKPVRLGDDEYFVLGDNSSIAEDSRTWLNRLPIVDNSLIGKPLSVIYPAKSVSLGSWQFQVPDPSRIGYIR